MTIVKTSELSGAALEWAVREIEKDHHFYRSTYSTEWAQAGPIIEREGISIERFKSGPNWSAFKFDTGDCEINVPSPLIAAMRCFICSKLGDTVDIPEELIR